MLFANHAALGIGGDKAAFGGGDACVFQRERGGVGMPSNRHQHGIGGKFALIGLHHHAIALLGKGVDGNALHHVDLAAV